MAKYPSDTKGLVFDIQGFSLHDGPGIRTLVFLKGCPLHCLWCCNPESISPEIQIGLMKAQCDKCGKCISACPKKAIHLVNDSLEIDRLVCDSCGECAKVCFPKALLTYGRAMTAAEAFLHVKKDKIFYQSSGGVTATGGEPLQQAAFVEALFELCHNDGINTAIETTGFAPRAVFEEVISLTDHILFDLKHLDSETHQKYTSRPNKIILENAKIAAASGRVLFRCPLVPGVNDTPANIRQTADFIKSVQGDKAAIELMPYHRLGAVKYEALGQAYRLPKVEPFDASGLEVVRRAYEETGIRCTVSK